MITFVATNLIAGIAGSSSAGLVLAAPVLQQAAAMTNAAVFHRTTVLRPWVWTPCRTQASCRPSAPSPV